MHGSVSIRAKLHIVDEHKCHPTLRPQSLCIVCPACHPFVRQGYELQEPPGKLCPYNFGSVFTVEIGGICICGVTRPIRPQCLFILRTKWHVCSALLTDLINSAQTARPLFSQDFIAREHKRAKMQSTANYTLQIETRILQFGIRILSGNVQIRRHSGNPMRNAIRTEHFIRFNYRIQVFRLPQQC